MWGHLNNNLSLKEIQQLKTQVITVTEFIEQNKARIRSDDRRMMNNHLKFVLDRLANMSVTVATQKRDPYQGSQAHVSGKTLIYDSNGQAKLVEQTGIPSSGEAWEAQFDANVLRPPCYQLPPQSMTDINRLKQAGEWDRVKNL